MVVVVIVSSGIPFLLAFGHPLSPLCRLGTARNCQRRLQLLYCTSVVADAGIHSIYNRPAVIACLLACSVTAPLSVVST